MHLFSSLSLSILRSRLLWTHKRAFITDTQSHFPLALHHTPHIALHHTSHSHTLDTSISPSDLSLSVLDPPELTNGTRCVVTKLRGNVIEVELLRDSRRENLNDNYHTPRNELIIING